MNLMTLEPPIRFCAAPAAPTMLAGIAQRDPDLVEGWRELIEAAPGSSIESHPEMLLGHTATDGLPTPGYVLHTLGDDGQIANLAVLLEKTVFLPLLGGTSGRVSLRGIRLAGGRLQGRDADAAVPTFSAAIEALLVSNAARYDCLLLEDLPIDSPWWGAFAMSPGLRVTTLVEPQMRWFLRFPETADAYWSRFSSKTRYNFRRQRRLFDHQWEAVTEPSQVAAFLADAAVVSASSWQGRRLGLRVRNDEAQLRQFRTLADLQALRCYLLRSQGEPVAFAVGTQWNGHFVLEEIGYDTRYAGHSPGTVLLLDMLDDMFQHDTPELLDFGFGDGAYKQLFGNESTHSGTLLVVSRRLVPTLAMGLSLLSARLGRMARAGLRFSGLDGWIRRCYRR